MCCCKTITQQELSNKNLLELLDFLKSIPAKTLKELRFSDLYQPWNSCNGIYFISSPDCKQIYMGKASRRCVADRIGAYFDSRENGFLNSFLKHIAKSKNLTLSSANLHDCYKDVLDWRLSVMFVETDNEEAVALINMIERMLIFHLRNYEICINHTNRRRDIDRHTPFKTLLTNR